MLNFSLKSVFNIKSIFLFVICVAVYSSSYAATITASVSGNWNNTATWGGAAVPVSGAGDNIVINTGITVTMTSAYTTTGTLTMNGTAYLDLNSFNATFGSVTGSGTIDDVSGGGTPTLTCGSDNTSTTFSGTVKNTTGTLSVTKTGTGTFTLSGGSNLTYIGATSVSAGTLVLVDCSAMANGTSTASFNISTGATLELNANTGNIDMGSSAAAGTVFSGTGTLRKTGTQRFSLGDQGSTSYKVYMNMTGGLIDVQAGTLFNGGWQGGYWTNNYAGLNIAAGAVVDIWDGNIVYVDAVTGAGNITKSSSFGSGSGLVIGVNGGTGTFSGTITQTGADVFSVTKQGTGTQTLSGANTFTGGVILSAGQLNLNNASALGVAGTFTIANGTTIDNTSGGSITLSTNNPMTWNGDFTFTGSNALNLGTGAVAMGASVRTVTTTASTLTVGGTISGTGGLTKSGAGTMALGNVNAANWTGTTTINNGILLLGTPGSDNYKSRVWVINNGGTLKYPSSNLVDNNAVMTVNTGGTIDFNNNADAIGSLVSAGNVINIGGNIYLTKPAAGNNSNFSGVASGTGSLNAGSGSSNTQILSGLNTYTGQTSIQQGTFSINTIKSVGGGSSSLGAPTTGANGTIAFGSNGNTGILKYTGTVQTTDRVIDLSGTTGGGTIDQSGTGLLIFSSAFTATGAGVKTLTLQGSTAGSGLLSGAIINGAGTTSLFKDGTGTWTLAGASTYTGTTTLNAGILTLGASGAISSSSNFIAAGGTFSTGAAAGFSETMGTLTLTGNATIALGTGSHSLNFAASNGTAWTGGQMLGITGWQGGYNSTSGTSGKIFTGASAELSAAKLAQLFFVNPGNGLSYTATQLGTGEIVPTSTPLPVRLVSFRGEKVKGTNELYWSTASEINSKYFEILHSWDGINFESIGKVNAAGNSASFSTYVFVDDAPVNGMNYYKLAQYDFDGAYETFTIIAISNNGERTFKINALYPNPASDYVTINFEAGASGKYCINVCDELGKELTMVTMEGLIGKNQFNVSTNSYSSGKYFVRILSPKKETIVSPIIVQH